MHCMERTWHDYDAQGRGDDGKVSMVLTEAAKRAAKKAEREAELIEYLLDANPYGVNLPDPSTGQLPINLAVDAKAAAAGSTGSATAGAASS